MTEQCGDPTYEYSETHDEFRKRRAEEEKVREVIIHILEENPEGINSTEMATALYRDRSIDPNMYVYVILEMVYSHQVLRDGDHIKLLPRTR